MATVSKLGYNIVYLRLCINVCVYSIVYALLYVNECYYQWVLLLVEWASIGHCFRVMVFVSACIYAYWSICLGASVRLLMNVWMNIKKYWSRGLYIGTVHCQSFLEILFYCMMVDMVLRNHRQPSPILFVTTKLFSFRNSMRVKALFGNEVAS